MTAVDDLTAIRRLLDVPHPSDSVTAAAGDGWMNSFGMRAAHGDQAGQLMGRRQSGAVVLVSSRPR